MARVTLREAVPGTVALRLTHIPVTRNQPTALATPDHSHGQRVTAFLGSSRYDDGEMERGISPEHVKARAPASLCTHRILESAPYACLGRRWRRTRSAR